MEISNAYSRVQVTGTRATGPDTATDKQSSFIHSFHKQILQMRCLMSKMDILTECTELKIWSCKSTAQPLLCSIGIQKCSPNMFLGTIELASCLSSDQDVCR